MIFTLFILGILVGGINTVAGGGSTLTLPLLIFLGLDPLTANATNRVGIVMQNISATSGFHAKGVNMFRWCWPLCIASLFGAYVGAKLAMDIPDDAFKLILALVMLMIVVVMIIDPVKRFKSFEPRLSLKYQLLATLAYFFVGIYGGFIQAGIGFLSILTLTLINGMNLVKANCVKVTCALFYAGISVAVFAYHGHILWTYGLVLGCGTALGAWLTSRYSVTRGHDWVRKVLIWVIIAMALRLIITSVY